MYEQTVEQLRQLGLVVLGESNVYPMTLARDEGAYDAFTIRVKVSSDRPPVLRINGRVSDTSNVVREVREFLKVVRA